MPEYLKDVDADIWRRDDDEVDEWQCLGGDATLLSRAEIAQRYSPLVSCDAYGDSIPSPTDTDTDIRALVASAFDDYASRLAVAWQSGSTEWNPFERCAKETAEAVRSGTVKVGDSTD